MRESRRRQSKRAKQGDLARGRIHKVIAPDDLVHFHRGVVDHDRQLVGSDTVGAAQNEVVDARRAEWVDRSTNVIRERDTLATPIEPNCRYPAERPRALLYLASPEAKAGSRIARSFIVLRVGRARGARNLASRTGTAERAADLQQVVNCPVVAGRALALPVRTERPPTIGSFIPIDPQPAQIVQHRGLCARYQPRAIEIFDAHDE